MRGWCAELTPCSLAVPVPGAVPRAPGVSPAPQHVPNVAAGPACEQWPSPTWHTSPELGEGHQGAAVAQGREWAALLLKLPLGACVPWCHCRALWLCGTSPHGCENAAPSSACCWHCCHWRCLCPLVLEQLPSKQLDGCLDSRRGVGQGSQTVPSALSPSAVPSPAPLAGGLTAALPACPGCSGCAFCRVGLGDEGSAVLGFLSSLVCSALP